MRTITDNYLLFDTQKEFNQQMLTYFYKRLCMFLAIAPKKSPELIFGKIDNTDDPCSAYFDEEKNTVGFDASRYDFRLDSFRYDQNELILSLPHNKIKYIIPLSDIYHELIHKIQFDQGIYEYNGLVEATADLYVYILTGQWNIEYMKEAMSLWYLLRHILKISRDNFYIYLRALIVNDKSLLEQMYTKPTFVKEVAKVYDGHQNKLWNEFKNNYYFPKKEAEFKKELDRLHSIIFYSY